MSTDNVGSGWVLGVDAGGTSTRALLADQTGRVLGRARSGPGNPNSAGAKVACQSVVEACRAAVPASMDPAQVGQIAVTMAGGSATGGVLPGLDSALAGAGFIVGPHYAADMLGAWFSGCTHDHGLVMIAGTGAVAAVVRDGALAEVIDGCGWLLGDDGAGFWLGRRVVHAALAAIDHRGPDTGLVEAVLAHCAGWAPANQKGGAVEMSEEGKPNRPGDPRRVAIIDHCYRLRPVQLAEFAPLLLAVDDDVSRAICAEAAELLQTTLAAGRRQAGDHAQVVLAGGVVAHYPSIRRALLSACPPGTSRAADGVVGATVVALRALGFSPDEATRQRLLSPA